MVRRLSPIYITTIIQSYFVMKVLRVQSAAFDRGEAVEERHYREVETAERRHKREQTTGTAGAHRTLDELHIL